MEDNNPLLVEPEVPNERKTSKIVARVLLSILIVIGTGLLVTCPLWVPRVVSILLPYYAPDVYVYSIDMTAPIQILTVENLPERKYETVGVSSYQPELFDPLTTKIVADGYGDLKIEGADDGISINVREIEVIKPFSVKVYDFFAASNSDSVVEVREDNERVWLFTHVDGLWKVSEDKRYFFFNNSIKGSDGVWRAVSRVADLRNKSLNTIPKIDCVSSNHRWSGEYLVTYSSMDNETSENPMWDHETFNGTYPTVICVWSTEGNLLYRAQATLNWMAASGYALTSEAGVLPKEPHVLYVYNHRYLAESYVDEVCSLVLQDMTNQSRHKEIKLFSPKEREGCPPLVFDLKDMTFDSETVVYTGQDAFEE